MASIGKTSTPVNELPKPELNPMINPTLGRNLGRWAHVYFTTPAEKREEAVSELLRELESGTSETPASSQPSPHSASRIQEREKIIKEFFGKSESMLPDEAQPEPLSSQVPDQLFASPAELSCPDCSYMNSRDQKYCGHCGSPLSTKARDIIIAGSARRQIAAQREDDTQWLRERALSSLEQYNGSTGSSGSKYLVLIFLILFAGFAYMRWAQSFASLVTAPKSVSGSEMATPRLETGTPAAGPADPLSDHAPDVSPPQQLTKEKAPADSAKTPARQNPVPAALRSKETDTKSAAALAPSETTASGSFQELVLAQQYLEGRNGRRNAPQAAQLLWKAVAKQNPEAAVLLSDLYARGDGVSKNCDQARLLLVAAAKKGSARAAQQLRTFDSHGCR